MRLLYRLLENLICPILVPGIFPIGFMVGAVGLMVYCDLWEKSNREITASSYDEVAGWIRQQPNLAAVVQQYNYDGEISRWEYDKIFENFKRLRKQSSRTRMMKELGNSWEKAIEE